MNRPTRRRKRSRHLDLEVVTAAVLDLRFDSHATWSLTDGATQLLEAREELDSLLKQLEPVLPQDAAEFFKVIEINDPGRYDTAKDLVAPLLEFAAVPSSRDCPRKSWLLTVHDLGTGPNLLVVLIDSPVVTDWLVCCKVGPESFFGYYEVGERMDERLGL